MPTLMILPLLLMMMTMTLVLMLVLMLVSMLMLLTAQLAVPPIHRRTAEPLESAAQSSHSQNLWFSAEPGRLIFAASSGRLPAGPASRFQSFVLIRCLGT